ncbi:MAG: hypothetical protein IT565_06020, partial [Rhodospirillales bacterium]|nr:hypothetical protein [Rhodospirillales bacterium]
MAAGEAVAQAPDTKKPALYPPYPEVWGRPLPMEEWMVDLSSVEIEEQADGEIVIHFGGGGTAGWVKFFSGETFVSTAVNDQRNPKRREGPNKVYQRITLSDGRRVNSRAHNYDEEGCYDGFNVTLSAPQPSKTTGAWTTKIIYVLHYRETPREPPYTEDCARQEKTDPFEEWVFSLPFHLHALKDGTFIAASGEGKVIIRFKPDLTSPYIDDDRFFAIDSA